MGAISAFDTEDKGLTAVGCSYKVSVQSRGAGHSWLPTGTVIGGGRIAGYAGRASHRRDWMVRPCPLRGVDVAKRPVMGSCASVGLVGTVSRLPFPRRFYPGSPDGFSLRFPLCDSTGNDPMPGWRAYGSSVRIKGSHCVRMTATSTHKTTEETAKVVVTSDRYGNETHGLEL